MQMDTTTNAIQWYSDYVNSLPNEEVQTEVQKVFLEIRQGVLARNMLQSDVYGNEIDIFNENEFFSDMSK